MTARDARTWTRLGDGEYEWMVGDFYVRRYHSGMRGAAATWLLYRVSYAPHRTLTKVKNPVAQSGGWPTLTAAKAKAREIYEAELATTEVTK